MLKIILIILIYSSIISSSKEISIEPEVEEEIQTVEQNHTFSNNNEPKEIVNNNHEIKQTPKEQEIYIQEMENLLNESDDGNDIIIKDAEDEASDLKEIIFKDDFDMWVDNDTTFANVEPNY